MKEVRVRFAPSPTGTLHIGGVRTALYNYLLAKKSGGKMLLRIEDTDQSRYVEGAEEYIKASLNWLGINIDEGPDQGGAFGPYRQSERKHLYREYSDQLIHSGHAYYAFDTPGELESMRERIKTAGGNAQYGSETRAQMRNSLTLEESEVSKLLKEGAPCVVRLKVEAGVQVKLADLIRGDVEVNSGLLDDKVLIKSDGMPTYHLANVVDDYLMKISHVIRGEEWLPSAPAHALLYKFLGWENAMPHFAHLPLLLKPDGNGKLSKRDADQMEFPIFPLTRIDTKSNKLAKGFKESGYLPEAVVNFLALLGWNPGTDQEIFTMDELIQAFTMERVSKAGTKFDIQKAKWFNQHYLRIKPDEELSAYLDEGLESVNWNETKKKKMEIVSILKERATFPQDFFELGKLFFIAPTQFDEKVVSKKWTRDVVRAITAFNEALMQEKKITPESASEKLSHITAKLGIARGKVMPALRLALTGGASGPDLMSTMSILGPEETGHRLSFAIKTLNEKRN